MNLVFLLFRQYLSTINYYFGWDDTCFNQWLTDTYLFTGTLNSSNSSTVKTATFSNSFSVTPVCVNAIADIDYYNHNDS